MCVELSRWNLFRQEGLLGLRTPSRIECGTMGLDKNTKHAASRRYPRIALSKGLLVAWQCSDGKGVSRVATLGLGGLFISAPDPPPVGTLVKLLFDVPDGEVRARAVVKNVEAGSGMAVAFVDMGYSDRARLNQLLKRLLH
jgi:PilZ domain